MQNILCNKNIFKGSTFSSQQEARRKGKGTERERRGTRAMCRGCSHECNIHWHIPWEEPRLALAWLLAAPGPLGSNSDSNKDSAGTHEREIL